MQSYLELSKAAQEQILEAAKQNQKIAVQATEAWARAIAPYAGQIPAIPALEGLPSAEDVIENSFSFAKKLVDSQHELVLGIARAWQPVADAAGSETKAAA